MFLSLESLEVLPIIKKLPFTGTEKRILGFVVLLSSSIVLFSSITLLLLNFDLNKKKKSESTNTAAIKNVESTEEEKVVREYDTLEREAIILTSEAYLRKGDIARAGEYLEKISSLKNQSARQRRLTAELFIQQGQREQAKVYLEQLRKEEPANATTAQLFIRTISPQTIISTPLDSLVKGLSKNSEVLLAAAQTIQSVAPIEAEQFLLESLICSPNHGKTLFALGSLYFYNAKMKDLAKAIEILTRAVAAEPQSPLYFSTLGLAELEILESTFPQDEKLFKSCEINLQRALSLEPNSPNNLFNLAELYSHNNEYALKCEELLLKALKISPTSWNASFKLGILYLKNQKYPGAIKQFETALSYSKANIRILHQLAVAYEKSENTSKTQEIYKQIVTINPKDHIALYKLQIIE